MSAFKVSFEEQSTSADFHEWKEKGERCQVSFYK